MRNQTACALSNVAEIDLHTQLQNQHNLFFELSHDLLCILNFDGYFVDLNPAWEETLGYSRAELLARPFTEFICPEERERTAAEIRQFIAKAERNARLENRYCHKQGDFRWLSWHISVSPENCMLVAVVRDITEDRQKAEEQQRLIAALRDSQRQLKQAERIASLGYWEAEVESGKFSISEGLYRLHGLPLDYPLKMAKELFGFTYDEEYNKFRSAVVLAIATQKPFEFEYNILRPNKEVRTLYGRGEPVTNEEGKVVKLEAIAQDITERKRTDAEMEKRAQQLLAAQRLAGLGYWQWTVEDNTLDVSEGGYHILGLPLDYPLHTVQDLVRFIPAEEWGIHYQAALQLKPDETAYNIQYRILRLDGATRYVRGRAEVTRNSEGKIARLNGVIQDVTDQVLAEKALREQERLLAEAQRIAHLGSWTWDLRTDTMTWSTEIYNLFGYDPATLQRSSQEGIGFVHPEDATIMAEVKKKLLSEDRPLQFRHRLLRRDGSVRHLEFRQKMTLDEQGEIALIDGTIQDVTELVEVEQALAQQTLDLERSNRDLAQFAYIASHDLQEPLRKIKSFTELLALRYSEQLDENARTWMNYIVDGAARMQTLIQDVLAYSRLGSSKDHYQSTDLNQILAQTQAGLHSLLLQTGAQISADPLPTIHANPTQMGQLLQNLFENAVKFRSQAPLVIQIRVESEPESWRILVRDNGIGIAPQDTERIFDMFGRLHPREEYEGNGVGLAICKKIVESHGGKIGVESTPGEGSLFWFTLPRSIS
jgi:PAS domain S-box-containing protein